MKTKIPLLVLFLFCHSILGSSQIKNDVAQDNIKGKVKSIIEKEYLFNNGIMNNGVSFKKICKQGNWLTKIIFTDNKPERKITREIKYR